MAKALIYGHSQSGGTGLDLEKALRMKGFKVTRVTRVGWSDKKLLDNVADVAADAAAAQVIALYGGGNSDKPTVEPLRKLIEALGAQKVLLVLPPVNLDRDDAQAHLAKNEANADGVKDLVPIYRLQGGASDFWPDGIHMKPGVKPSVALAKQIVDDIRERGALPVWPWVVGSAVLAALAVAWWRRRG